MDAVEIFLVLSIGVPNEGLPLYNCFLLLGVGLPKPFLFKNDGATKGLPANEFVVCRLPICWNFVAGKAEI